MRHRVIDESISKAWIDAAKDLGIRVVVPFTLQAAEIATVSYEAHVLDFGGPKGTVVGVTGDELRDGRENQGYFVSNLAQSYRCYDKKLFIDTLNDWGWFGPTERRPAWYTGKRWS